MLLLDVCVVILMKESILKIILGSIILEVILICMFILTGDFNEVAWHSLSSVGIIFIYSLPCLFYSKIYDDEKYKYISIIGVCFAAILALVSILELWNIISISNDLSKFLGTLNVVVWSLVFIAEILSYISVNNIISSFKKISILLIMICDLFIIGIIWTSLPDGFLLRLYYIIIVLTVGSLVCTKILTRIYKKEIDLRNIMENEENIHQNISNIDIDLQSYKEQPSVAPVVNYSQLQNKDQILVEPTNNSSQNVTLDKNNQANLLNIEKTIDDIKSSDNI